MIKCRVYFICVFILLISVLSGCASIVTGTHESVSVTTPPVKGATCMLTNNKGTWYVSDTPGSVDIHRAFGDMHITCHKTGCSPASKTVESNTKAMVAGNIVFGGIVGGGLDVADGAAYTYPQKIVIPMKCKK